METAKVGDRVSVESERVGDACREGIVLEVVGSADTVHYRVQWEDGHQSTFFPSSGSLRIVPEVEKARRV